MAKISAGIIGGAGYTGGEMLRILLRHPQVDLAFVQSSSQANLPVSQVHRDLAGDTELKFVADMQTGVDVLFLCVSHGDARIFLEKNKVPAHTKIIDLSQDFRLADSSHDFVYGLPELRKEKITGARHVANPGCFATCIQLGLLPLAFGGYLQNEVHINAITGSTGAGQKPTETSHFSWRNNNISTYKVFQHQHLGEIKQSLKSLQPDFNQHLYFVPVRGNFTRGIYASMYLKTKLSAEAATDLFKRYYQHAPFVHVTYDNPDLKQVVNTNKGLVHLEKHDDILFIVSMIDNLLKGASGQAVQNMNLMFGLEEQAGLRLKAGYF